MRLLIDLAARYLGHPKRLLLSEARRSGLKVAPRREVVARLEAYFDGGAD